MLPEYSSSSRFGVAYPLHREFPHLGPGTYNQDFNSMIYNMETKISSPKGYTLGARTAPILPPPKNNGVPGPTAYQKSMTEFRPPKPSYKPFGSSCPREMGIVLTGKDAPSVGTYDWFVEHKPVEWQRDTNLKPINLPPITITSTVPANTNKLTTSRDERNFQRKVRCFENCFGLG